MHGRWGGGEEEEERELIWRRWYKYLSFSELPLLATLLLPNNVSEDEMDEKRGSQVCYSDGRFQLEWNKLLTASFQKAQFVWAGIWGAWVERPHLCREILFDDYWIPVKISVSWSDKIDLNAVAQCSLGSLSLQCKGSLTFFSLWENLEFWQWWA